MTKLKITEFGNPVLRKVAKLISDEEIKSPKFRQLIKEMSELVKSGEYGVGLAAPQVAVSKALSVITIRPTPSHPEREEFDMVIINPSYKGIGQKVDKWEGCMSFGAGQPVFAQTKRYEQIHAAYQDELGIEHKEQFSGLKAHVFQHETDHLNGVLFVDLVEDSKTWMSASEYKKMLAEKSSS